MGAEPVTGTYGADPMDDTDLPTMLKENLAAEWIAISTCSEAIRWLGCGDVTTRRMPESILAGQEEHANGIISLLGNPEGTRSCRPA